MRGKILIRPLSSLLLACFILLFTTIAGCGHFGGVPIDPWDDCADKQTDKDGNCDSQPYLAVLDISPAPNLSA